MRTHRRHLISLALATGLLAAGLPATGAFAARVELLNGKIQSGDPSHVASGRAAVVQIDGAKRVLTLRNFSVRGGGGVKIYLVPRAVRANGEIGQKANRRVLGTLKANSGNTQLTIPRSVDLRRFNSVVFWCVPFSLTLGRADLRPS